MQKSFYPISRLQPNLIIVNLAREGLALALPTDVTLAILGFLTQIPSRDLCRCFQIVKQGKQALGQLPFGQCPPVSANHFTPDPRRLVSTGETALRSLSRVSPNSLLFFQSFFCFLCLCFHSAF